MQSAAQTYRSVARKTSNLRELEANLLLQAAARLQSVHDSWDNSSTSLGDALLFNRKLWTIFLTSVTNNDNPLPAELRQNIANIGIFVINHTLNVMGNPKPERLRSLININRQLAAGLNGNA